MILWLLGLPDQAKRMMEININDATERGHVRSLTYALAHSACPIAFYTGDLSSADRYLRMLVERLQNHGSVWFEKWARCYTGVLLIKRGDLPGGTRQLKIAIDELPQNSVHLRYLACLLELADGLCGDGQIEGALAMIETALNLCRRNEEFWCLAELLRVRGEIALKAGAPKDAEDYFNQSLDLSRRQKVPSWELRGATSLARLWQGQRRSGEAYALLASVYDRFTEGFGTIDLRTAKNLLSELTEVSKAKPSQIKEALDQSEKEDEPCAHE
jgi:predicted ATPase